MLPLLRMSLPEAAICIKQKKEKRKKKNYSRFREQQKNDTKSRLKKHIAKQSRRHGGPWWA